MRSYKHTMTISLHINILSVLIERTASFKHVSEDSISMCMSTVNCPILNYIHRVVSLYTVRCVVEHIDRSCGKASDVHYNKCSLCIIIEERQMCPIDEGKVREWTLAAALIEKSMRNCCNHCSEFNKGTWN